MVSGEGCSMASEETDAGVDAAGKHFAYLFEAKGIQRYILDSGPLRDLVGASDLVAGLASSDENDLIAEVLRALGVHAEGVNFSRRAGGAFCIHGNKHTLD